MKKKPSTKHTLHRVISLSPIKNSPAAAATILNGTTMRQIRMSVMASEKRKTFAGSLRSFLYLSKYVITIKRFHPSATQKIKLSRIAIAVPP